MANWCSVEAEIDCLDNRQAETLYQKLVTAKTEADKRNQGFYVGSDRYFFDATIEFFDNTVTLAGSVKWGFSDEEMISFIKYLKSIAVIESAEICYEEGGCLLYGKYSYENGTLTDTYLPAECFPDYDEENYYLQLEQLLETKSQTKTIGEVL